MRTIRNLRRTSLTAAFLLTSTAALAQPPSPPPVEAADRAAVVEEIAAALGETYVFPETAEAMAARMRERLAAGAYDEARDALAFADRLTGDLQEVSRDKHLRVVWAPPRPGDRAEGPSPEEQRARYLEEMRRENFCFEQVERLAGNVGYLKLDCFAQVGTAGPTAVAAMNFLAHSDALIVDLRDNGGGDPGMIQLLTSYLLEEPTHLNSFYVRKSGETQQFWTQAHVAGPKLAGVPVWVLTSGQTFSAAEEFSYNLRNLERGILVGETTGGGAHPVESYRLEDHPFVVFVPFGRAVNPITGTNWEGVGVEPHRQVAAADALDVAHREALARLAETADDPERRTRLEFLRETLELRRQAPAQLSAQDLEAYVGVYGPRKITRDGSTLLYQRGDGPKLPLVPAGGDRFLLGDDDGFRVRFERDARGRVVRIVGLYADGRTEPHERG